GAAADRARRAHHRPRPRRHAHPARPDPRAEPRRGHHGAPLLPPARAGAAHLRPRGDLRARPARRVRAGERPRRAAPRRPAARSRGTGGARRAGRGRRRAGLGARRRGRGARGRPAAGALSRGPPRGARAARGAARAAGPAPARREPGGHLPQVLPQRGSLMPGLQAVFRKELADHFSSRRFVILFLLVLVAGLGASYVAAQSIREELGRASDSSASVFLMLFTASSGALPAYTTFIGFLGPLVGLALGFDAINGEQARGTLSRLLAQPIYRDAVINGKFLAGLATIAVMLVSIPLLAAGLGLPLVGQPPGLGDVARLVLFLAVSVIYVAFWMAAAILFSILFRQTATAALAGIALWIVCAFFVGML